ncbi:hypothetical protein C0J52_12499 [Blattella germanica]|nr:hypothetical protein C0J52_12499 [Blattella germanica]
MVRYGNLNTKKLKHVTGWGGGMRRVICSWYTDKKPLDLAECVSKYRSRHGWSHRDIIKLAHPKSKNPEIAAIFKYVIHGLEKAKSECTDQRAQQILTYLQNIEDFKHCEDEQHAARLIEIHSLTLEHVPGHFLKSKEVMSLDMKNLSLLQPTYIMRTTEPETKTKSVPQPHPKIVDALKQLLSSSFKLLISTGLRYLVAVDVRINMTQGKCWHCNNVSPAHAAALMALCLVKAEREVNVVAFSEEGALAPLPSGLVDLTQPLLWAKKMKKEVDVFLIVTDNQVKQGKLKAAKALQQYRSALNLPKANEDGMLDIAGFDGQVPRVIEAFSRGAF